MKYIELQQQLSDFYVFSLSDIRLIWPDFSSRRFYEWQKKGYIDKITKGYYIFCNVEVDDMLRCYVSNKIYSPSYVSLESALSYYNVIPETVYAVTAVSTRRTYQFNTKFGKFIYKTVKPDVYNGYDVIEFKKSKVKMAFLEKALLDYVYLRKDIKTRDDFLQLRFNWDVLAEAVNEERIYNLLELFRNSAFDKKINFLMECINNA